MYHYGLTIKEHREAKHWKQNQLANVWPKSNGDRGVSPDYVSLVETGKRQIDNTTVLRQLCGILDIPLWKMGFYGKWAFLITTPFIQMLFLRREL